MKRSGEALQCYRKVIEINPQNDDAYCRTGIILMLLNMDDPLSYLDKAVGINPNNARAWKARGIILML
jgi:Flp pilus assembly protein TadD